MFKKSLILFTGISGGSDRFAAGKVGLIFQRKWYS